MRLPAFVLSLICLAASAQDFKLRFPPNPPRYIKQIPLGVITERDLLNQLGIPQQKIELEGEVRWQYERVDQENSMRSSWSYVIVDGLVVDLIYNASGCMFGNCSYNGMSARKEQGK